MVNQATALTKTGVGDWLVQRVSAVIVLSYVIFLVAFWCCHTPMTYDVWHGLYQLRAMRVFTILTAVSIGMHAWIGIWSVLMDYVKCALLRLLIQIVVVISLLVELIWLIDILWGGV